MIFKDFLGKELSVGDEVVTTPKGYRGLVKAEIVAFTPLQVRVKYINDWNYGTPGREELFLTPASTLMKINNAPTVEQKLKVEALIAVHEEWSEEYGFGYIAVDDLKEKFLPELQEIFCPK